MTAGWAATVIRFWFEELMPDNWFAGGAALDAAIRTRFGALHETLKRSPPNPTTADADEILAAVIVLDQFSRNIHRQKAEAFATDTMALGLAEYAVDRGLDGKMPPERRLFLYMPFMHSETPAIQERSVALFTELALPEHLRYAIGHKATIDRFGRFPARNAALGRISTPEEIAFMERREND
ncbi:MAG TPA: DUF924 family protein [Alphaproteobacteria bacterium]|nr:DUF924 family protein [Alphaproteobacteria bacterium]